MNLVIVESPAKAKTINKYLGDNYIVLASYGHIRDLPSKNGSVDPEQNFKMEWEVDSFSKKYLKEITDAAKDSNKIILATDPDREGEAIAWHVKEYLNEKKLLKDKAVERVVFNEITKKAVIRTIPATPPDLVQTLHSPNFLCIFSNQSEGGNMNGKMTVSIVKLIVGVDNQSIADFMAIKFIRLNDLFKVTRDPRYLHLF